MSKSKGNFYTLRDLLDAGFTPAAIRLELIKTHYRSNANFMQQGLRDAQRRIDKWRRFLDAAGEATEQGEPDERVVREFSKAMHDDLNVAGAIGSIDAWINRTPDPSCADGDTLALFDATLGVLTLEVRSQEKSDDDPAATKIEALIEARNEARRKKDWAASDRIRDELQVMGVTITDTPKGTQWERVAAL